MSAELERLREIGWAAWDPIGLRGSDCPRDEYDAYLIEAAARIRAGACVADVAADLDRIADEHMGLGSPTAASRAASLRTATLIEAEIAASAREACNRSGPTSDL